MKLFQQFHGNSMAASRALLFSAQALTSSITPLKCTIMGARDPKTSVVPILENWVQQDRESKYPQLQEIIRDLRSTRRFNHALQMLQWMGDKGGYELSAEDFAVQLELTSRVHGIELVEVYFDAIPNNLRGYEVYCALLSSYAAHDCLEKAEATMQKLRELGFARSAFPYNVMLRFYSKRGYPGNVHILAEEMREKGINKDEITYNILLKTYSHNSLIPEMEKLVTELEAYCNVHRELQNTLTMLKKSEEESRKKLNEGYLSRIESLVGLNDMDGAERVWEEWFSNKKEIDFRIPEVMFHAYYRKCQWEKAEAIVLRMTESGVKPDACTFDKLAFLEENEKEFRIPKPMIRACAMKLRREEAEATVLRMKKSGIEPDAYTLDHLADAYGECNQMDEAVETSMKAISVSKPGWKPDLYTIAKCFKHLERQGDDAVKEELYKMLKEHCGVSPRLCDDLKNCIDVPDSELVREMVTNLERYL